jgi:hypothetical protein
MRTYQARLRKLHRFLAPVMILPVLLTLITGSIYQMVDLAGNGGDFIAKGRRHRAALRHAQ